MEYLKPTLNVVATVAELVLGGLEEGSERIPEVGPFTKLQADFDGIGLDE
jgi:hypothetical protein